MPEEKKIKVAIYEEEYWPVYEIWDPKDCRLCDVVEIPKSLLEEYKEAMEKFRAVQEKLRRIIEELDKRRS